MNKSVLIRKLTDTEISILKNELEINATSWRPHAITPGLTALRDGKSIHLQWINNDLTISFERWKQFPETKKIIEFFASPNKIGRVYWHRLQPGNNIHPHNDAGMPFVELGSLLHRYHIYLDVDPDIEIFMNDCIIDTQWASNSIIDFELRNLHYYKNKSQSTLYLLVFDVIGEPPPGFEPRRVYTLVYPNTPL